MSVALKLVLLAISLIALVLACLFTLFRVWAPEPKNDGDWW